MFAIPKVNPLVRAVLVVGGVAGLVTGVTLASHGSPVAAVTGSTVNAATEDLDVSLDNIAYAGSVAGFAFDNLVPGGDPSPAEGNAFWLKNVGGTDFSDITLGIPTLPTTTGSPNLDKVKVILTDPGADGLLDGVNDTEVLNQSILGLNTGDVSLAFGLDAAPSDPQKLFVQVSLDADAFAGTTASVGSFDFEFTGVVTPPVEEEI
jgi:hypothetical protein